MTDTADLTFFIKKDNTKPAIQFQIKNPDGTARNLTGSALFFYMKKGGTLKVNAGVCTPINASQGIYEYRWVAADTNESGQFRAEVRIDGVETYPTDGYITVEVIDDLP